MNNLRILHKNNTFKLCFSFNSLIAPFDAIIKQKKELLKDYNKHQLIINYQQNNRFYTTSKVLDATEDSGLLKKIFSKVGFGGKSGKSHLRLCSYTLYETVADKVNYFDFFNEFNLPNTFNSWFIVTELHVWMLMLRSMAEGPETGEDGRYLRNNVVEAMWADVNTRAKKLGANNPSGTREQISILSEQFQASLIAYDEGIMSHDQVLASALWRRFFEQDCKNYTDIERLVKYVRQQVQMLDSISRENFLIKPKIEWIPLKSIRV